MFSRNVPGTTEALEKACVGLAGCGGLGSNAAVALVRAGVGSLILVDFDLVEESNLNRQYFFQADVGQRKCEVLAQRLRSINPQVRLEVHDEKIVPGSVARLFGTADLLVEAFDRAESKQWLIESWIAMGHDKKVVCGNGLSGCGHLEDLKVRRLGPIYFCGDGQTDMSLGLSAPRVAIVANMQAAVAIELLLEKAAQP
jgi:sulfur carrier protein ThiS adenylyltransferase